jgi:hypothetical protein
MSMSCMDCAMCKAALILLCLSGSALAFMGGDWNLGLKTCKTFLDRSELHKVVIVE